VRSKKNIDYRLEAGAHNILGVFIQDNWMWERKSVVMNAVL